MPINQSDERGLTIIELVVVVTISSLLLSALLRFVVIGYPLSKTTYLQSRSTESARLQLKRLAKSLRELRQSDTGSYPLITAENQRIIFYANVDSDALTERVRYQLDGTNLIRAIIKPSGDPVLYNEADEQAAVIVTSIRNGATPIFTYYSGDYPADQTPLAPADLTEAKYIQFHLMIDADPNVPPPPIDVISQVQLRNLKTNLGEIVASPGP